MHALNLPAYDCNIRKKDDQQLIFDPIRKKYLVLTPEEWVRQHFINLMIGHLGYPKGLIQLELGMRYFKSAKRCDIIVMKRDMNPFMIVECKAPEVKLSEKTIRQASTYNKVLGAEYLAITNGLKHFIWQQRDDQYFQLNEFPLFPNGE